jgi:hypothetical protein
LTCAEHTVLLRGKCDRASCRSQSCPCAPASRQCAPFRRLLRNHLPGNGYLLAYLIAVMATTLSATVIIRDENQRSYPTAEAGNSLFNVDHVGLALRFRLHDLPDTVARFACGAARLLQFQRAAPNGRWPFSPPFPLAPTCRARLRRGHVW